MKWFSFSHVVIALNIRGDPEGLEGGGVGGGVTADDDRGCYDPIDPV